jgi:hypothetical protein
MKWPTNCVQLYLSQVRVLVAFQDKPKLLLVMQLLCESMMNVSHVLLVKAAVDSIFIALNYSSALLKAGIAIKRQSRCELRLNNLKWSNT